MYNNTEVMPTGQRILTVKNPKNDETYTVRFIVVKRDCKPILGLRAVQHMQLIIYIIIIHCPGVGAFPRPFCVPNSVALASLTLQVGDWAIH